jgi:hypothetical protein
MNDTRDRITFRICMLLVVFMAGLIVSGLTAFPLVSELRILGSILEINPSLPPEHYSDLQFWIARVGVALRENDTRYPFIAYGTDWLAFAHLVIAVAFIGPMRDPVRNVWVVTFGLIACAGVIPLALFAGAVREVPLYWRLIDCSFGVIGAIPLWLARRNIMLLQTMEAEKGGDSGEIRKRYLL